MSTLLPQCRDKIRAIVSRNHRGNAYLKDLLTINTGGEIKTLTVAALSIFRVYSKRLRPMREYMFRTHYSKDLETLGFCHRVRSSPLRLTSYVRQFHVFALSSFSTYCCDCQRDRFVDPTEVVEGRRPKGGSARITLCKAGMQLRVKAALSSNIQRSSQKASGLI